MALLTRTKKPETRETIEAEVAAAQARLAEAQAANASAQEEFRRLSGLLTPFVDAPAVDDVTILRARAKLPHATAHAAEMKANLREAEKAVATVRRRLAEMMVPEWRAAVQEKITALDVALGPAEVAARELVATLEQADRALSQTLGASQTFIERGLGWFPLTPGGLLAAWREYIRRAGYQAREADPTGFFVIGRVRR